MLRFVLIIWFCFSLCALSICQTDAPSQTGHVDIKVVIVDDLTPKPVALTDFNIRGGSFDQVFRTDADGAIHADLGTGSYTLSNVNALAFKEKTYKWTKAFDIRAGQTTTLTLTQEDATLADKPAARVISDEAKIYQQCRAGVVTVQCDGGHGSGFLIDKRGLIVTNFHVAGDSDEIAVRLRKGERYAAKIVSSDQKSDVVVLQINPSIVSSMTVLPLLTDAESPCVEGEKVVAIGNPLNQETALTSGIVSKVEDDALISDVNINHGNSGGPLLNMAGEVVGITTFLDPGQPNGPGISGVVAIKRAEECIKQALTQVDSLTPPSAEKLPDVSSVPIADDMLTTVASKLSGDEPYFKSPRNFRTYVETPFQSAANDIKFQQEWRKIIGRRYKGKQIPKEMDLPHGPRAFWTKYVGADTAPLVVIKAIPWPQGKASNFWNHVLLGPSAPRDQYELRDDFQKMELLRDGAVAQPILRERVRDTQIYEGYDNFIVDTAMAGVYGYDPRVFAPGGKLELRVWKNDRKDYTAVKIDEKFRTKLWNQYRDWAAIAGPYDQMPVAPPALAKVAAKDKLTPATEVVHPKSKEEPSAPKPVPPSSTDPKPKPPTPTPPTPAPTPTPTPPPPAPLVGLLDGLEPDTTAMDARIKKVDTALGNLKAWDSIIAIKTSATGDFENVENWAAIHDLLVKAQVRGEIEIKIRRNDNVITSKALAH